MSKLDKKDIVYKLKREIHRLKQENKKLRSNLRTYNLAFKKTEQFLKDYTGKFNLEEIIFAAQNDLSLEEYEELINE